MSIQVYMITQEQDSWTPQQEQDSAHCGFGAGLTTEAMLEAGDITTATIRSVSVSFYLGV